ncbi:exonuclease domain-containing protein [Aquimonas sp.]|jgi:DNA polymerase-3 subunit epsilon|uniref:exonuclease domain-containing protein n=1 Tax=Aquimonas sp. TaxID=1872588 RepID=UPI0037BF920C
MIWLRRLQYAQRARGTPLAQHYARPLPGLSTPWLQGEFLAVDFETSGLDTEHDRILSMGWVQVKDARILMPSARHLLIHSDESVGQSATVHGLTDTDIQHGLSLSAAVLELVEALQGRSLIAHGAPIELNFLSAACRRCFGVPPTLRAIDTLAIERRLRRHEVDPHGYLRLHACRERYGLPNYRAHNAAIDAIACAELLLAQVGRIGNPAKLTLRDLV